MMIMSPILVLPLTVSLQRFQSITLSECLDRLPMSLRDVTAEINLGVFFAWQAINSVLNASPSFMISVGDNRLCLASEVHRLRHSPGSSFSWERWIYGLFG